MENMQEIYGRCVKFFDSNGCEIACTEVPKRVPPDTRLCGRVQAMLPSAAYAHTPPSSLTMVRMAVSLTTASPKLPPTGLLTSR